MAVGVTHMGRNARRWGLLVVAAVLGLSMGAPSVADVAEPTLTYQTWYFRAKPESPIVQTPQGPIQPLGGEGTPAPQQSPGGYVVGFAGGNTGADNSDLAYAAFQWDLGAALGGSVDEYIVTFTKSPEGRGDAGTPVLQACNIVVPWAASPTSNPWAARPPADCAVAVAAQVGTAEGKETYTFDLTALAKTWADGKGEGVMIQPGSPTATEPLPPFQTTLAGYDHPDAALRPRVTFRFSGAAAASDTGAVDTGLVPDASIGESAEGLLQPAPNVDVFPSDVGSAPSTPSVGGTGGTASPSSPGGSALPGRRVSASNPGFAWGLLLLIPIALFVFFGAATALGPLGDPMLPREGGVTRLIRQRAATGAAP